MRQLRVVAGRCRELPPCQEDVDPILAKNAPVLTPILLLVGQVDPRPPYAAPRLARNRNFSGLPPGIRRPPASRACPVVGLGGPSGRSGLAIPPDAVSRRSRRPVQ